MKKLISFRKTKPVDHTAFKNDLRTSALVTDCPSDLENTVTLYNSTLKTTLNKFAPILTKVMTIRPSTPWFNDEIKLAKQSKRSAERKWRNSRSNSDLILYKAKRNMKFYYDGGPYCLLS